MKKKPKPKKLSPSASLLNSLSSSIFRLNFLGLIIAGMAAYAASVNIVLAGAPFLLALFCGIVVGLLAPNTVAALPAGFLSISLASLAFGSGLFSAQAISPSFLALVNGVIAGSMAAVAASIRANKWKLYLTYVLLLVTIINFTYAAQSLNRKKIWPGLDGRRSSLLEVAAEEPPDEGYSIDTFYYLKIFYLMKAGANYYNAQAAAFDRDARRSGVPPEGVMGWRMPTLFWLWSRILPANGALIDYLFVFSSILVLVAAFLIAARFLKPEAALLSPLLLAPYLLAGATTLWFVFAEYWASFLGLFAIVLYLYRRSSLRYSENLAYLFAFLAAAVREHFIYLSVAGLISALAYTKRRGWLWLLPLGGFLAFYVLHYLRVVPYYEGISLRLSPWWQGGSLSWVQSTINFGTLFYPHKSILVYMSLVSALLGVLLVRSKEDRLFLFLSLVIPLATFMIFGKKWSEYWGAIFMPLVFVLAPLALQPVFPANTGDKPFSQIPEKQRRTK